MRGSTVCVLTQQKVNFQYEQKLTPLLASHPCIFDSLKSIITLQGKVQSNISIVSFKIVIQ